MVFSSIPFLYYFLPVSLLAYLCTPARFKNATLLLCSLFFYGWGEPKFLLFMVFSIVQGYFFGILIERARSRKRAKLFLTLSVCLGLALLIYCKYADFFLTNFNALTGASLPLLRITLPVGISFYTFQLLSYVVDVYRRDVPAQHHLVDLAAYIAMFPQLIAGPIVRYSTINEMLKSRTHSFAKCAEGIRRFILGLSKKVLLANTLGELCRLYHSSPEPSALFCWLYLIAYTLHVYFDFSGYSDMAIGLGKLFGFDFPENFNYPYISASISEFWRRWHISLGSWFRDYVYIPLGGNRVGAIRHFCNILIVWLLTGLWHGSAWTFLVWGGYFGILLILEKHLWGDFLPRLGILRHFYVMGFVLISFLIFDAASLPDAFMTFRRLIGLGGVPLTSPSSLYYADSYKFLLGIGILGATPLPALAVKALRQKTALSILEPFVLLLLLLLCTGFIVDGSFNPFLYFRF